MQQQQTIRVALPTSTKLNANAAHNASNPKSTGNAMANSAPTTGFDPYSPTVKMQQDRLKRAHDELRFHQHELEMGHGQVGQSEQFEQVE